MHMNDNIIILPQPAKSAKLRAGGTPHPVRKKPIAHLNEAQVETLISAAKKISRNPLRDSTMILMAYRHGYRVSELLNLPWEYVFFDRAEIYIERLKGSKSGTHPLQGREIRALRALKREQPDSGMVFVSERRGPLTPGSFQYLLKGCGEKAGIGFRVHPHALRHACGFYLINKGYNTRVVQEYLGHKDIRNTQIYTAVDAKQFRGFWKT